jgi:hypothetical protein
MSTYLDTRTSASNPNSFLYQNHPPSSPVATNSNLVQQQQPQPQSEHHQQQQQPQPQKQVTDEKSNEIHYSNNSNSNDHGLLVDYLVSPKPSPSRALQPNLSEDINNNNNNIEITKRRLSSSSASSSNALTLKPIKLATDINNSKEHLLKRDPFQLKSNNNNNNNNNNVSNANNASAAATTTAATAPASTASLAISPKLAKHYEKKKNNKLYKREKLKEAKNEYEERIEEYFHQLTIGCQQTECRNKFCASGRGKTKLHKRQFVSFIVFN